VLDRFRHWLAGLEANRSPITIALAMAIPLLSFLGGLAMILALPADYFVRPREPLDRQRHGYRIVLRVLRNLLGGLIVLAGMVMAVPLVPGPGALFMLIGIGLVDFPGKRALQLRLLRQRHVLHSVNRVRARFGRPPIETAVGGGQSVVDNKP
jgi:hypothetical protein